MIYITGDLHGKVERAVSDAKRIGIKQSDTFVLLGDVGVNYYGHGMGDEHRKRTLNRLGITFLCVHGNHEMRPESVGTYETMQWNGGTVYVEPEFPNLLFAQDGSIFTIEGRKCLVLGGAYSVDKYYRIIRGAKWFADEQPSEESKRRAEENIAKAGNKVDFVFSHTCPAKATPIHAFLPGVDQATVDHSTEEWLDKIESNLEYTEWYCGHWHLDGYTYRQDKQGIIRFLFADVLTVPDKYTGEDNGKQ